MFSKLRKPLAQAAEQSKHLSTEMGTSSNFHANRQEFVWLNTSTSDSRQSRLIGFDHSTRGSSNALLLGGRVQEEMEKAITDSLAAHWDQDIAQRQYGHTRHQM